jgi:phosphate-selective porin OprO/OprP
LEKEEEAVKKKIFVTGAALLATAFIGQTASAKTLEDILKEKGVITEQDYKEVTKVKPYDYKLGKGFTFTSPDEKFQLTLGGRMQFRYTFTDQDPRFSSGKITDTDTSTFDAQRIRLIFQGYAYSKNLTYKLELDARKLAQSSQSNQGLLDAYLNYKFMDEAQILLGQTKAKFSRDYLISDGSLMFVDRAPFITKVVPGYDLGAIFHGDISKGLVEYNVAVSNGAGQTTASGDNNNMFSSRVVFNPFGVMSNDEPDLAISKKPLLSVGANYLYTNIKYTGAGVPTTTNNLGFANQKQFSPTVASTNEFNNYGFDAEFKWMGLSVQGEGIFLQANNDIEQKVTRSTGYYAQAGYMITPELGLAFRYSNYDPDCNKGNDLQTEQIGSVSYYFNKHNLKLQADVANLHDQAGITVRQTGNKPYDDMQYRFQAQIIF